ncbi:MAG: Rieske 2Fe-2S domain-containing protein [Chlorogloeopsis fritschii C42_A2020_084]|uniref:aromatic ring-hydroxylating dioxygenase subunit alpha n=1 Tax=Chlorogloeopsis fritschii TaxID=1124 RepID=UPI0019F75FB2|nr:Rieske 2Fe-2S domain-containing protein [Chlorogloeopsis fritschii]MBF2007808.1 Rieske 2Fe-2S domain-containing protein [Chlorogloeopsis fritschii C42_A2020_084]
MTTEASLEGDRHNTREKEELFQWAKQWYPVAVVDFLDPSRPHALQLLGKDIVLWRDGSGKWRCFEDFCPHRLAPLSEGRVESDGTLMCAYHAWRFNSEGSCVSIPQSKDKQTEAKHLSNQKSCAVVYPTQECQGLLWVWAEAGTQAQLESQQCTPRIIPELRDNSDRAVQLFWNVRDLPYGWDFFMENVSDPAHVPVSHHGLVGNRYQDAKYYDMIKVREISTQEGFSFEIIPTAANIEQAVHDFQPPCHMRIVSTSKDGSKLILALYATPTRPGWCRHIGCQVLVKNEAGKIPKGLGIFGLPMPIWLGHVLASLFLHQDLVFLHYQEKILAKQRNDKWLKAVYTPNPQDKMVIAFRQWLEQRAGGSIAWDSRSSSELPAKELDKQKLFDVWTTHTQNCKVCQDALKNINRLTVFAYGAAIACFCLGVILDARSLAIKVALTTLEQTNASFLTVIPPAVVWWAFAGAFLFATGGYLLKKLSRLFYVYEFEHARND